jgi:hypothetical protein
MFALNLFNTQAGPAPGADANRNTSTYARSPAHDALARDLAQASITLLKNNGILPVSPADVKTIAIFGDQDTAAGGGSGHVEAPYTITPTQGITAFLTGQNPAAPTGTCTFDVGYDYYQTDSPSVSASSKEECCNACAAYSGCKAFTWDGANTCWVKPSAAGRRADPTVISGNCTGSTPAPPTPGGFNITYYPTQDPAAAAAAAQGADLVVMVVATDSSEGGDRASLGFAAWMDSLVVSLVAANPNTVVVARCPGACTMSWASAAPAILYELLAGQESGTSIANTIFGANNPSGKLPLTFPNPAPAGQTFPTDTWLSPVGGGPVIPTMWPGTDRGRGFPEADYSENLLMGYRWYDAQNTSPQWPFGHGLSYSTFSYAPLNVVGAVSPSASATIYSTICNTAGPAGAEVAQLYIGYPAAANEPPKQLKGFEKLAIGPGDCSGVGFPVQASDLWVWDVVSQTWQLIPGTYTLSLGSSSRDIRQTGTLTVTA